MERREKRALAFLLAASLLCLALVGLAAGTLRRNGRRPSSGPGGRSSTGRRRSCWRGMGRRSCPGA